MVLAQCTPHWEGQAENFVNPTSSIFAFTLNAFFLYLYVYVYKIKTIY